MRARPRAVQPSPPAASPRRPPRCCAPATGSSAVDGRRGLPSTRSPRRSGRTAAPARRPTAAAPPSRSSSSSSAVGRCSPSRSPRVYNAKDKAMRIGIELPAADRGRRAADGRLGQPADDGHRDRDDRLDDRSALRVQGAQEGPGVVGSYTVTEQSFSTSASQALWVLALISLSLGVINLFPFLPLDGGHVFWALAEKVRGRRIPFAVMERAGLVGVALDRRRVRHRPQQRHLDPHRPGLSHPLSTARAVVR